MKFTLGVGSNYGMVRLWKDIVLITSPRRFTTLKILISKSLDRKIPFSDWSMKTPNQNV